MRYATTRKGAKMARQKSEFLSAFGTAFQIFKAVSDEVLNLGGNDEHVRQILTNKSLAQELAKLIVGNAVEVFQVIVDYTQFLADMIAAGKYDWVSPDITQEHFPTTDKGTIELRAELIHLGKTMSTDAVLKKLDQRGCRPATLRELLAFGSKHPEKQREFPIFAFGSVWTRSGGDRYVPYLYGHEAERRLLLYWYSPDWFDDCLSLAVRK